MILITVMYPAGPKNSSNRGYYRELTFRCEGTVEQHGPGDCAAATWTGERRRHEPVDQVICAALFRSQEEFQTLFKRTDRKFADIPKFTSVQPVVEINEALDNCGERREFVGAEAELVGGGLCRGPLLCREARQ